MKTTIRVLSVACMLFAAAKINAQEISYATAAPLSALTFSSSTSDNYENNASVSTKVFREFSQDFQNATNVSWVAVDQVSCAYFKLNGLPVRANYDKKGNMEYMIRYYYGTQVPSDIARLMRKGGYDMNITHVTEIKRRYTTTWLVKMEDETSFLTIRVNPDGELSVYEEYNKATD